MDIIVHELGKWFHDYQSNYLSNGRFILLKKYDGKVDNVGYTNQIKIISANFDDLLYEDIAESKGITDGIICLSNEHTAIYRFVTTNGFHIFNSNETEKKIIKKSNTSIIPYGERLIVVEHQGDCFVCEDSIYECYDSKLNLIWKHTQHGFINGGEYQIFKDHVEIGGDRKLFFDEKGYIEEKQVYHLPRNLIDQSDWYQNGEWYPFLDQIGERCISAKSISKSLLNNQEYVLHCHSPKKYYIAKFDKQLRMIWKRELPYCSDIMQLLYVNGVYYSIGNKTKDSFYVTAINELGEVIEESDNIISSEFCGYIVNGKLVVFFNRTDNLNNTERKLLNDGVMIANGYYLIVSKK